MKKNVCFFVLMALLLPIFCGFSEEGKNDSSSMTFQDLSDDAVVAEVGAYSITAMELKSYMAGYSSISTWGKEQILATLNSMILDLLFANACLEEKITVKQVEVLYYTEYYFNKIGVDINNQEATDYYFETTDPYADMEDFLNKSTFFLLKSKYLAKKNLLSVMKVSHVFFSAEKKSPAERREVRNRAVQAFYDIEAGTLAYPDIFTTYSEDIETKEKLGEIGSCSQKINNSFIPKKAVARILSAGLFTPVLVENSRGYSIVINTSYQIPEGKKIDEVVEGLLKKYQPKYYISF